ncbi:MAG: SPOR domain-containing protein [Flavobacteriales bacterium]
MKQIFIYLLPLGFILFSSCSNKQINDETPYAVQIKEVRSYYKALDIQNRLEENGIESYILSEETTDGNWYRVLSGAEESIEDIRDYKKELESIISIEDFEIINYQKIKPNIVLNFEEKLTEGKRIKSKKPNVPDKIFDLINKFPDDKNFIVKRFFVSNAPDSIKNIRRFKAAYDNINHDLPRGLSMKNLMKKSECMAEVIYEDNLFGDRVTLDIIKLKKDLDLDGKKSVSNMEIADYFAELILETGDYNFEDKLKIDISSFQSLSGYKVTIQPKKSKDDLRTYFILVSKDLKFLVFSQSTDKTDEEIIEVIKELGKSNGLETYDEFYNAFYTLPSDCSITDKFVSISSEKLSRKYARSRDNAKWAKKMVGHWNTSVYYNGKENRTWSLAFFDLLGKSRVNQVNNLYVKQSKKNRNNKIIDVLDSKGVLFKGKYPTELSFPGNRFVVAIGNANGGKLTSDKMLTISECLQLK